MAVDQWLETPARSVRACEGETRVADGGRADVPTKLHMAAPTARALLGPMRQELLSLERRARRLIDVLKLPEADEAALRAAHDGLVEARTRIEQLYEGSSKR